MQLSRHHFRVLYIIARTGSIAKLDHQWDNSIQLLCKHDYLQHTGTLTHLSALGYDTIGWIPYHTTADPASIAHDAALWYPGPNFQWTKLL